MLYRADTETLSWQHDTAAPLFIPPSNASPRRRLRGRVRTAGVRIQALARVLVEVERVRGDAVQCVHLAPESSSHVIVGTAEDVSEIMSTS